DHGRPDARQDRRNRAGPVLGAGPHAQRVPVTLDPGFPVARLGAGETALPFVAERAQGAEGEDLHRVHVVESEAGADLHAGALVLAGDLGALDVAAAVRLGELGASSRRRLGAPFVGVVV